MLAIKFDSRLSNDLNLGALGRGMPGITPRLGACLAEAASTCLEEEHHHSGVAMQIDGDCDHRMRIQWVDEGIRDQQRRAWNDREYATEQGAYGIAALLVTELTEYTVVERARKGPGFDYWLGKKDSPAPLFQDKARFEVSGIRKGDSQAIAARVGRKIRQIKPADDALPALVAIVEFGSPRTRVKTK